MGILETAHALSKIKGGGNRRHTEEFIASVELIYQQHWLDIHIKLWKKKKKYETERLLFGDLSRTGAQTNVDSNLNTFRRTHIPRKRSTLMFQNIINDAISRQGFCVLCCTHTQHVMNPDPVGGVGWHWQSGRSSDGKKQRWHCQFIPETPEAHRVLFTTSASPSA